MAYATIHKGRRLVLLAAVLLAASATVAAAPDNGARAVDSESRVLRATFPAVFPPVFKETASGVPTGFGIELLEEIAARSNYKITYQPAPTWSAAMQVLRDGDADLIPNLGITPRREREFAFSRPIQRLAVHVFVNTAETDARDLPGLTRRGIPVAVVEANIAETLLLEPTEITTQVFESLAEAFLALQIGEIAALAYPRPVIENLARRAGISNRLLMVEKPLVEIERAVAVRRGNEALLAELAPVINELLNDPAYEILHSRWYGMPPHSFWTPRRVAWLVIAILAAGSAAWFVYRYRLLGQANRRIHAAHAFANTILDTTAEGILTCDSVGVIHTANRAATRLLGRSDSDQTAMRLDDYLSSPEALEFQERRKAVAAGTLPSGRSDAAWETVLTRHDGQTVPVRIGIAPMSGDEESLLVLTLHDLTHQRAAEREAQYLVNYDLLTGLLNLSGANLVLDNLLAQARRHQEPVACLHVAIAGLTHINAAFGRQAGDTVLVRLAELLRRHTRDSDLLARRQEPLLARSGGSHFLLALPDTSSEQARVVAQRVLEALRDAPLDFGSESFHGDARIGLAMFPAHADTRDQLVALSEAALKQAKERTGTMIHEYDTSERERGLENQRWLERLREAIQKQQFILHFQPILSLAKDRVAHYECLLRLGNPDGTLAMPGQFIGIAERDGLITRIDYRVLEMALSNLVELESTHPDVSLSVNLSGMHLGDDALREWLEQMFAELQINPRRFVFEITETAAVHNLLRARTFIESFKDLGCRFALDDFGVGFSSFAHLQSLPVDIVKIDGSFVRDMDRNPQSRALVRALTEVAHSLGKQVTAEYVENAQILALVRELGIEHAQGYHIGRPQADLMIQLHQYSNLAASGSSS